MVRVGFAPTGGVETAQVSDFAFCGVCSFGTSFKNWYVLSTRAGATIAFHEIQPTLSVTGLM
jgi:hypothetical protein